MRKNNIKETVLISLPIEDLQTVIIDCVNACLKNNRTHNEQQESPERLLTVQETAKFLNLSVPTIYSKVSRSELPFMKRSKRLYFSSVELLEYLKKGRNKTTTEIQAEAETYLRNNKKGL